MIRRAATSGPLRQLLLALPTYGIIAGRDDDGVAALIGPIGLSWRIVSGTADAEMLFELASFNIDRDVSADVAAASLEDD